MSDLLGVATTLLSVIDRAIQLSDQRKQNTSVAHELHNFFHDLQINVKHLQEKVLCVGCNNSAKWALDALRDDLEGALFEAKDTLNKGFIRSLWNAPKIQSQIQALRERVMTSFQTRLSVASLDVALEGKHAQDAFQTAMLKINKDLQEIYFSTNTFVKQEMQLALRKGLREALQPLTTAMESQSHGIEVALSKIRSVHPQTSDTEKFLEDVLAALDGLSVKGHSDAAASAHSSSHKKSTNQLKWYQDPVTWGTMIDPVKATDGHTYDRWTILDNNMVKSPFTPNDPHPFRIAAEDLDVRSRLFHKFPIQEVQFKAKRAVYRGAALEEFELEHFGDAAMMLEHVLEWAPHDAECAEKLQYVRRLINGLDDIYNSGPSDDTDSVASDISTSSSQIIENNESQMSSQRLQTNALELISSWSDADEPQILLPSPSAHSSERHSLGRKVNINNMWIVKKGLKGFTGLFTKRSNTRLLESSPDGVVCEFRGCNALEEGAVASKTEPSAGATIAAASEPVQNKLVLLKGNKYAYNLEDLLQASKPVQKKLILFKGSKYAYNLEDLLQASAEMVGSGSMGTVFKLFLEDGVILAMKRLKDSVIVREDFNQQISEVGKLRHENLVPLVGYHLSKEESKVERLLVCEYITNGSLATLLHRNEGASKTFFNWDTRVKVALGTALGIDYLHSHGFAHGNIKSSNILLTYDYKSCISDYVLAQLFSTTPATNRIVGYHAPEVEDNLRVTEKADVYSFGVILLELLTGEDPSQDSVFCEGKNLPHWVQTLLRKGRTAHVFDTKLMKYQDREEEMVRMLEIAMLCVETSPDQRPAMKQVVRMLEDLKNWVVKVTY